MRQQYYGGGRFLKKVMRSALVAVLILAAAAGAVLLITVLLLALMDFMISLHLPGLQKETPKMLLVGMLFCFFLPLSLLTYLPHARIRFRLRKRPWHLCWQIPLVLLVAVGWTWLLDRLGGSAINEMEAWFWVGAGGNAIILMLFSAWLMLRISPRPREAAPPPHVPWDEDEAELEHGHAAQIGMAYGVPGHKEVRDYAAIAEQTRLTPAQQAQRNKTRHLRRNLWWQLPLFASLAAGLIVFSFKGTFLTPFHLLSAPDVIEITAASPAIFFAGAVFIPAWLLNQYLHASPSYKTASVKAKIQKWGHAAVRRSRAVCFVLIFVCFFISIAEFILMPHFGYSHCDRYRYSGIPNSVQYLLPVKWVKKDKLRAGLCVIPRH